MPIIYWPLIIYQIIYIGAKLHISPLKPQYSMQDRQNGNSGTAQAALLNKIF